MDGCQTPGAPAATPRLDFDAATGWSLWWPCASCGGARVSLLAGPDAARMDDALVAAQEHIDARPCPGCTTRRQREGRCASTPTAWYDTTLQEWVVRAVDAAGEDTILPLEIRWYDAPLALVQTAAANVVFADDATQPLAVHPDDVRLHRSIRWDSE